MKGTPPYYTLEFTNFFYINLQNLQFWDLWFTLWTCCTAQLFLLPFIFFVLQANWKLPEKNYGFTGFEKFIWLFLCLWKAWKCNGNKLGLRKIMIYLKNLKSRLNLVVWFIFITQRCLGDQFSNDYLVSCRLKRLFILFFLFKLWSVHPNINRKKEAYMLPAKGCHYDNRTAVLLLKQNPKIIRYSCIHTTTFKSAIRLCRVPHHQKYGLIAWVQIR